MSNCLKCGFELQGTATECPRCGVILAKARAGAAPTPPPSEDDTYLPAVPPGSHYVTRDAAKTLTGALPWLRLIVGYSFVVIFLMLLLSFLVPLLADLSAESMGMALVYLLYSWVGLTMVLPLQRSLRGASRLTDAGDSAGLETFVLEQATFWRRAGVLTAISIVLMIAAIGLVVVGAVMARL